MADKNFAADFRRMTGKHFSRSPLDYLQIMFRHNLRYMWWFRKHLRKPSNKLYSAVISRSFRKFGLEIRPKECGKGLYLGHPYNITVGSEVSIGDFCSLHKGCTIGAENRGKRKGSPVLGNRVFVGINATVIGNIKIGNIKIGNDVMIAPNSFVNCDVPDHSVVLGNPAVIHHKDNATSGYIGFCD